MLYKNVYFHQLSVYRRRFERAINQADTMHKDYLTHNEINIFTGRILNDYLNNYNCVEIADEEYTDRADVLEVINFDDDFIFAKLGRRKDIYAYHLRNTETLEPSPIQRGEMQELEVFTYLLIDRRYFTIAYLREQSAPSIQKIGELFSNCFSDEEVFGEISSITIDDALPILDRKQQIGTMNYTISLPPHGSELFPVDVTGLSEEEYEALSSQKSIEIQVKLVAERHKDAFEERGQLRNVLEKITSFAKKVTIKARDEGELTQTYNIVDHPFTRNTGFNFNRDIRDPHQIQNEIQQRLRETYLADRRTILEYCRV